jgi:hypothetical protein
MADWQWASGVFDWSSESTFDCDFLVGNNFVPIKQVSKYLKSPLPKLHPRHT